MKQKKAARSGEKISGPKPLNNFDTKGGEIVRIQGLQMHVLTLVANSAFLNYIRRNYRTVLRAGIVGMVLTRQRDNQPFNVTAKR